MRHWIGNLSAGGYLLLALGFIYLPVVILVLFSFQKGDLPVPPFDGPGLRWYAEAERYVAMMSRLFNPDWSGKYGTPQAQYKATENLLGHPGGCPRLPILPVTDPASLGAIRGVLTEVGLLGAPAVAAS